MPVTDVYSSDEVGYIALQCPETEHYHVQSEALLVEVLDDRALALSCGFDEHLIKPAEPARLIREIAAARSFHS